jgi:hypothetical protein
MRAAILRLPIRMWKSTAAGSAQRCSKEWNPPRVKRQVAFARRGAASLRCRAIPYGDLFVGASCART